MNPQDKETKNPTPSLEDNGLGVPSEGHNEPLSNGQAEIAVAENIEQETGDVSTPEQEILEDPEIKAEPSADHTQVPELHPEVAEAQVQVVTPHSEAQELDKAAQEVGGIITGEAAPSNNLGQTQGEFNRPTAQEQIVEVVIPEPQAFDAMSSGKFAKGEGNVYKQALFGKWKEMAYAKIPKIFGGHKEAPKQPLVPKTT